MTDIEFGKLTVTNFRSIRRTVELPLDGTFVLLHGKNGAGKTTLLSALELALTGGIAGLRRIDPGYKQHLVHHGQSESSIALEFGGPGPRRSHAITVSRNGSTGSGALDASLGGHFAERCYLAQATLSRLLEMYQESKPSSDSPLTQYVKEILRLDQLDNLIDGLHVAADLRNTRREVPQYRESETKAKDLERSRSSLTTELERLALQIDNLRSDIDRDAELIGAGDVDLTEEGSVTRWLTILNQTTDVTVLTHLEETAREIRSIAVRLAARRADPRSPSIVEQAAREVASATESVEQWRSRIGTPLEQLLDHARAFLPDLPSVATVGPVEATANALDRLAAERGRVRSLLEEQRDFAGERAAGDQRLAEIDQQLALIDEQLLTRADAAEQVAQALAGLAPHIHGNGCPVCGRDYGEISSASLASVVASRIGELSATAAQMHELRTARATAVAERQRLTRRFSELESHTIPKANLTALQTRLTAMSQISAATEKLQPQAEDGAVALRVLAEVQRRHAEYLARDREVFEARRALGDMARRLEVPWEPSDEVLSDAAARLLAVATERLEALSRRREATNRVIEGLQRTLSLLALRTQAQTSLETTAEQLAAEHMRYQEAEGRRSVIRDVIHAANGVRNDTIREVFNTRLNRVWRDLFVRLAPSEPFVPAFEVPSGDRPTVSAPLTTAHRAGGQGGAPATMLSAGNLNTAALTLFIALHLSAAPRLPWLVLDDPVQSMDDVHVTQLAAVLRALSRDHGRRIVIAVHDRALFDYLALELAPSRQGDRLITAELSQSRDGTVLTPHVTEWERDPVSVG